MSFKTILLEKENRVAKIILKAPQTKNALNPEMRTELLTAFRQVGEDDFFKVVVLTGSGNAFCAGGDIKRMERRTLPIIRSRVKTAQSIVKAMLELEKPIIGAINGSAAGAGVSLALACDILIASEQAKFAEAFVKIGLIPDLGAFYLLPLRIGVARAKELMLIGEPINAQEAERIGLVNRVVPHEKLEEETLALALRLANGPSQCYAMIKSALNLWTSNLAHLFEIESNMQAVAFSSEDFDEGRKAFLEKRQPLFGGK